MHGRNRNCKPLKGLVEVSGFEPLTPCLQTGSGQKGPDPRPAWVSAYTLCLSRFQVNSDDYRNYVEAG